MTSQPTPPDPIAQQRLQHAHLISRLRHDLDRLAHETTDTAMDLLARIDDVTETSSLGRVPTSWCWRDLGPQGQEELWRELGSWVGWIRARYPLARKIPECWDQHPELVEELTALWLAWQLAYQIPDAPLTAAADWHDRWLPGVLHRLEHGPFSLDCSTSHTFRPSAAYASSPD